MSHIQQTPVGQCWAGFGLTVTVARCDAARVTLHVAGELDLASARLLGACLQYRLDMGHRFVTADLSGLAFIDSCGLEVLTEAHQTFLDRDGTLELTGLSARTRCVARIAGLDTILRIAPDVAETDIVA